MKKKLILILSLALLCLSLFVVTASASGLVSYTPEITEPNSTSLFGNYFYHHCDEHLFFDFYVLSSPMTTYLVEIEAFKEFILINEISDYTSFIDVLTSMVDDSSNWTCADADTASQLIYSLKYNFPENVFYYFKNYGDDYSSGMQGFSSQLKFLYQDYEYQCKIDGSSVTAEGFDTYVENSLNSEMFKEAYKNYGAQEVLSGMYSAGASSQSGSSGSTGGSNDDSGSGQNGSPNISNDELTEGESMVEPPACPLCNPDSTCDHYIMGYQQGFHDALLSDLNKDNLQQAFDQGYTYSNSEDFQTTINVAKQESIEEFKQSEEYNKALQDNLEEWQSSEEFSQIIDSTIEESVNDYKQSDEYNITLEAQYNAGIEAGYDTGYSEAAELVYDKGVLAGMAQYQSSTEYQNSMQGFYNDGYFDGYDKGRADGKNVPNVTGLVLLIISIIGAVILFAVVSRKIKKKKRGSK